MTVAAQMPSASPHCEIVTVLWGQWHVDAFLNVNIPTLLAEGNMPAMAAKLTIRYRLYTTRTDAVRIQRSSAFQRLAALIPVEIEHIRVTPRTDPMGMHLKIWRANREASARRGGYLLLMPPDVGWSDGSFRHMADLVLAGRKAIFITYQRVVADTFIPAMGELSRGGDSICLSGRQLAALTLRHLHPIVGAHLRDSPYFIQHPEIILWTVPGQGFLCRMLAREMFLFEASRFQYTSNGLLADTPLDLGEIAVVERSDDVFSASLAPLGKDTHWYSTKQRANPLDIARWWLTYDSPFNDILVRFSLRFQHDGADDGAWRACDAAVRVFLRRVVMNREVLRFWRYSRRLGQGGVSRLLAVALETGVAGRIAGRWGRVTVILPEDDAEVDGLLDALGAMKQPNRALLAALNHHFAVEPRDTPPLRDRLAASRSLDLKSAAGSVIAIAAEEDGTVTVDGRPARLVEFPLPWYEIVVIARPLAATPARLHS